MEELYRKVDLKALTELVKLDDVEKRKVPDNGAASFGIDLSQGRGAAAAEVGSAGRSSGARRAGRSSRTATPTCAPASSSSRANWHGRHYDRVETLKDHYVIRPTIDRTFTPGELSTISDHKDNVHWFKAASETAYIFNVHVIGYDPDIKDTTGRLYLDPEARSSPAGS